MKCLQGVLQGSRAWHEARAGRFCASEASAAMGVSKYQSRAALLRQKKTGIEEDVTDAKQRLFAAGHASEASTRDAAEAIVGEALYPATGTAEIEGLPLLASFDGITMAEDPSWENKLLNSDLARQIETGELEPHYWAQMEHQMLVSGGTRVLFTASDGCGDVRHLWYESLPERRAQVIAAWKQFAADLADYVPAEIIDKSEPDAIMSLPALVVQVRGEVTSSNLTHFKAQAERFLSNVKTELVTDADFVNADFVSKFCSRVEGDIETAKRMALEQTVTVAELMRTLDHISEQTRAKRLELDRLVTRRKTEIKESIVMGARTAYEAHIAALKVETGGLWNYVPSSLPDFATAAKNKRTIATLQDAVDTALANAKIAASAIGADIRAKLTWLAETAAGFEFLFADKATLVGKHFDDFKMSVTMRLDAHKAAEARKEQERIAAAARVAEQERERAAAVAETQRLARLQEVTDAAKDMAAALTQMPAEREPVNIPPHGKYTLSGVTSGSATLPSKLAEATLNVVAINRRFGSGIVFTADFILNTLKVPASAIVKGNSLWSESSFQVICCMLGEHVRNVANAREEAVA